MSKFHIIKIEVDPRGYRSLIYLDGEMLQGVTDIRLDIEDNGESRVTITLIPQSVHVTGEVATTEITQVQT